MTYIDTNIFIYLLEKHPMYSEVVAEKLEVLSKDSNPFITSVIGITEFLAGTVSSNLNTLYKVPRLQFMALDETLAAQAAALQKQNKMQVGDAIHLATAISARSKSFFTNDKILANIVKDYMPVINLD